MKKTAKKISRKRNTKKHKGGILGYYLYGGELDIKDATLRSAVDTSRIYISMANAIPAAFSRFFSTIMRLGPSLIAKIDPTSLLYKTVRGFFSFTGEAVATPAAMFASWNDRRARENLLKKLNNAKITGNKINYPHIWKNVSVDNFLIRNPSIENKVVNKFKFLRGAHWDELRGETIGDHSFYPATRGYAYECDEHYKSWFGKYQEKKTKYEDIACRRRDLTGAEIKLDADIRNFAKMMDKDYEKNRTDYEPQWSNKMTDEQRLAHKKHPAEHSAHWDNKSAAKKSIKNEFDRVYGNFKHYDEQPRDWRYEESSATLANSTRDAWLEQNPLDVLSFDPEKLKINVTESKEEVKKTEEEITKALQKIPLDENETSLKKGGKKNRRITKNKRKN